MIFELLLLFFGSCVLFWFELTIFMKRKHSYWQGRNIRFFDTAKLFSTWDWLTLKHGFHEIEQIVYDAAKKEGITTYAGIVEFGTPILYVMDPQLIKTVLVKDFDSFVDRRALGVEETEPLFSKILSNMKGQAWKDLRSTVSPTFTTGKIRRMYSVFNDSSDKLAGFLRRETQKGAEVELRDAIGRFTMDVIASAAFGLDSQSFASYQSDFAKFAKQFQNQFSGIRALRFQLLNFSPKLMSMLRIPLTDHDATDFFARVIQDTIKHREATGDKRLDFLQLMMEARNAGTESSSVEELRGFEKEAQLKSSHSKVSLTEELLLAQSLVFFLGGFDTIETLLLMAAYELALNSDVQKKLHDELKDALASNHGELNYDLVMKLEYLDQVVSETLRKWPPAFRLERKATKAYQIPNTQSIIENDTLLTVPVYGIHRDERYYPNPEKFDPERFTVENKLKRNPYTYLPFGAGPRNCIAMRFALAEGKSAIAQLSLNFKLEPSHKTEIPLTFKPLSAFKPANGMWLRVSPRN